MSYLSNDTNVAPLASSLSAFVHDRRTAYVDFVRRLAQIESPSTDPEAQREVQEVLADALYDLGFATWFLPGREHGGALYARPAGSSCDRPRQVLIGHCDTVWDHGTLETMPVEVDEETVRGPGVFDMKGGLSCLVFALRALDALGHSPGATPLVLVTGDEEIGSPESRRHVERLAGVSERAFVLEPALGPDGKIKTARKGTGQLEIFVCASENSTEGNGVLELSRLVQCLNDLNDPDRGVTVNVGVIDAQQDPETGTFEGRLTADVRVPTQDDADRLRRIVNALETDAPGITLDVRGGFNRPPMERTSGTERLWRHAKRLGRSLEIDLEEGRSGGASDGNYTSRYVPTLDGLGAVGDGAHADHEFLDIDRTLDRCALLALLLLMPCSADG